MYTKKHRQKNKYWSFQIKQDKQGKFESKNIDRILDSIFKLGLHKNQNYVALFGIVMTHGYMNDSENLFRMAYLRKIDELKYQPQQSFNFQSKLNVFHKEVGLLYSCQSFWKKFVDIQAPLSAICALRLYSSNPVNQFRSWMNIRVQNLLSAYCMSVNFIDRNLIRDKYNTLLQNNIINYNLFVEVSKICGKSIMIHKDSIPSRDPLLISGGQVVNRNQFPAKDIFHLFTQDERLFYEVGFKQYQQKIMNEYIHQEQANIIYLDQDAQAKRVLQNVIHLEQLEQKKALRLTPIIPINWAFNYIPPQNQLFQHMHIQDEGIKEKQIEEKISEKIEEKIEVKKEEKIEEKIEQKIEQKIEEKVDVKIENKIQEKIEEDIQVNQSISQVSKIYQTQFSQDKSKYSIANQFSLVDEAMINPLVEQLLSQCQEDDYSQGSVQFKGTGITQVKLGINEEIRVLGYRFKFSFSTFKILLCENINLLSKDNMEEENNVGYYDQEQEIWVEKQNYDINI